MADSTTYRLSTVLLCLPNAKALARSALATVRMRWPERKPQRSRWGQRPHGTVTLDVIPPIGLLVGGKSGSVVETAGWTTMRERERALRVHPRARIHGMASAWGTPVVIDPRIGTTGSVERVAEPCMPLRRRSSERYGYIGERSAVGRESTFSDENHRDRGRSSLPVARRIQAASRGNVPGSTESSLVGRGCRRQRPSPRPLGQGG